MSKAHVALLYSNAVLIFSVFVVLTAWVYLQYYGTSNAVQILMTP